MDDSKNTNVYVSGLPTDIMMDEFKDLMQQKGGIIAADDEGESIMATNTICEIQAVLLSMVTNVGMHNE